MADTLALDIRASLGWLFQDSLDLSTVSDASKLEYSTNLADGTGTDQVDKVWHDRRTLAAAANDDLDLTALTNSIFGSTVTISFARIKAVLIVNTATAPGDDLSIGNATTNQWTAPFGAAGDVIKLPADSCLLLMNKKNGWTVTNNVSDILRITNSGIGSVTYNIAIVGTSA